MQPEPTQPARRARILVADDEPHIRRVLVTVLQRASFEVDEAVDGSAALECLETGTRYDCILLDLMMPGATGLEVLDAVRAHPGHRGVPVIMLTAKGQDTDRQEALAGGANDFLTKPFSPKKLISRINEIISDH